MGEMRRVISGYEASSSADRGPERMIIPRKYDVFVSHAGPDKLSIAEPLHNQLKRFGLHSFLDIDMKCSDDDASAQMLEAMAEAKIGVFILSPEFAERRWTMKELRKFLERIETEKKHVRPALLPVFYRLSIEESRRIIAENGPHESRLRRAGFFEDWRQRECSTEMARSAMWRITEFTGVEVKRLGSREEKSSQEIYCEVVAMVMACMYEKGLM